MTQDHRREDVPGLIFNMEGDVRDLIRWADVVFELGSSDNDPSDCLLVVGPAIRAVAERVERDWEHAWDLCRQSREGGR